MSNVPPEREGPQDCRGWRRYGGIFTMGRPIWEQCPEPATVVLTVRQEGVQQEFPACQACWQECIENAVEILDVRPIPTEAPAHG